MHSKKVKKCTYSSLLRFEMLGFFLTKGETPILSILSGDIYCFYLSSQGPPPKNQNAVSTVIKKQKYKTKVVASKII
jgi:hypothetical protein